MALVTEAVVVGVVLALAMLLANVLVPFASATRLAVVSFVVGGMVHLAFEAAGANAWYCRHGAACLRRGYR